MTKSNQGKRLCVEPARDGGFFVSDYERLSSHSLIVFTGSLGACLGYIAEQLEPPQAEAVACDVAPASLKGQPYTGPVPGMLSDEELQSRAKRLAAIREQEARAQAQERAKAEASYAADVRRYMPRGFA